MDKEMVLLLSIYLILEVYFPEAGMITQLVLIPTLTHQVELESIMVLIRAI